MSCEVIYDKKIMVFSCLPDKNEVEGAIDEIVLKILLFDI